MKGKTTGNNIGLSSSSRQAGMKNKEDNKNMNDNIDDVYIIL